MNELQKKTLAMLLPNFDPDPSLIVPRGQLPELLLAEIESSEEGKFLVAGQRGMGKTTELRRLHSLVNRPDMLPVFVQYGAQPTISHPSLLDSMITALQKQSGLKPKPQLIRKFREWFSEDEEIVSAEEGSQGSAALGGKLPILQAERAVSHAKKKRLTKKVRVRKTIQDLLEPFNDLVDEMRQATSKRVVFIVDDIDKIQDVPSIEETFIHSSHIVYSIKSPCVFTVPITYATSSFLRIGSLSYGNICRVPAIEICTAAGERNESEFQFLKDVLKRRMPFNPIPDEALDQIVKYSGGVLIDAMRMARGICKQSILNSAFEVNAQAVEDELQHLVDDYKFAFDDIALWQKLSKLCSATDKRIIMTDDMLPDLLYKMIVLEYQKKELWFDVHPAARRLYEQNAATIDKL